MDSPTDAAHVLIVDDLPANLDVLGRLLESEGHQVLAAPSGEVALRVAAEERPDLILLDVMMPGLDGYEVCRRLKADAATADIPVIFITAREAADSLDRAFVAGAVDYIAKPFHADEVAHRVRTHVKISRLARELSAKNHDLVVTNETLRVEIERRAKAEEDRDTADQRLSALADREAKRWGLGAAENDGFVGRSKTLRRILDDVRRVRNFGSVNVLITGESGTGKELIARAIHFGGPRAGGPFIPVNCVAIPTELAESMFFGHVRGAFTGAAMDRKGCFELAHGGTLFLDEIGDMPANLQAKLLRVLEDGRVTPLGASREKQVDVRVVAATNANLAQQIESGAFRRDLYFRLAQYSVEAPPLRDRREDIAPLAAHFVALFSQEMGIPGPAVDPQFIAALADHPFPGNVRELKNIIERAMIQSGGGTLEPRHLQLGIGGGVRFNPSDSVSSTAAGETVESIAADLPLNLEAAEDILIRRALAATGGNIAQAARKLGVNRTRIYRKLGQKSADEP